MAPGAVAWRSVSRWVSLSELLFLIRGSERVRRPRADSASLAALAARKELKTFYSTF